MDDRLAEDASISNSDVIVKYKGVSNDASGGFASMSPDFFNKTDERVDTYMSRITAKSSAEITGFGASAY